MVEVTLKRNKANQLVAFEMSGHANSGPYGYDLVCAAVSAIAFGTVNAIISICEIKPIVEQKDGGGYLKVILPNQMDETAFEKAQTLLEGMRVSFETIERDYSEFIHIT